MISPDAHDIFHEFARKFGRNDGRSVVAGGIANGDYSSWAQNLTRSVHHLHLLTGDGQGKVFPWEAYSRLASLDALIVIARPGQAGMQSPQRLHFSLSMAGGS